MNIIVILVLILLISILGALCIYLITSNNRGKREQYQKRGKRVVVKNGIDVRHQMLGSEKGAFFTGNLSDRATCLVNRNSQIIWQVYLQDIDTGESIYRRFYNHMWIGRQNEHAGDVGVYLPNGYSVSKTHCKIFEQDSVLYICDMNSRNHTYVNGVRVDAPMPLVSGSILRMGDMKLEIRFEK